MCEVGHDWKQNIIESTSHTYPYRIMPVALLSPSLIPPHYSNCKSVTMNASSDVSSCPAIERCALVVTVRVHELHVEGDEEESSSFAAPKEVVADAPPEALGEADDDLDKDLESQVVAQLTETISEQQKNYPDCNYRSPLPLERETACVFPLWMSALIIILSITGILGAIFELRYQFQWSSQ